MPHTQRAGPDDSELAAACNNDPEAFARLYERHFAAVYAYVRYRVDDRASADDITAVVFTAALTGIRTYQPGRGTFRAWLVAIARNRIRDHHRRRARWKWRPLDWISDRPASTPDPSALLELDQRRTAVLAAVAILTDRERDIMGLKFGAGLANTEIAAATGLSESYVGVIIYRALGRLRKRLDSVEERHE